MSNRAPDEMSTETIQRYLDNAVGETDYWRDQYGEHQARADAAHHMIGVWDLRAEQYEEWLVARTAEEDNADS